MCLTDRNWKMGTVLTLVCVLTFLHYVGAQMRGPVLSLYAAAHGATATGVGLIMGAHMAAAAIGSIPLGRVSDVWGRRRLMLGGMAVGVVTSLLLPIVEDELALMMIYGLAGLGVAAFTPSALSLVGDAAPPDRIGHAYAWYSTAHYGAIGVGPFLGGLVAEWFGYRAAFVVSAVGIAIALAVGRALPRSAESGGSSGATFVDIRSNASIWAGWIVSVSGLLIQGVVFPFYPLLGQEQGLGPAAIGLVLLVLGLAKHSRADTSWVVGGSHGAVFSVCDRWRPCGGGGDGAVAARSRSSGDTGAERSIWCRQRRSVRRCERRFGGRQHAANSRPRHGRLQHVALFGICPRVVRPRPRDHALWISGGLRRGGRRGWDRYVRCRDPLGGS
jgi:MFS family permease